MASHLTADEQAKCNEIVDQAIAGLLERLHKDLAMEHVIMEHVIVVALITQACNHGPDEPSTFSGLLCQANCSEAFAESIVRHTATRMEQSRLGTSRARH